MKKQTTPTTTTPRLGLRIETLRKMANALDDDALREVIGGQMSTDTRSRVNSGACQ